MEELEGWKWGEQARSQSSLNSKAFGATGAPCWMELPSPGINRLPAATGHLGRAACGPVLPAHHPLGQLAFCRLWLPSLSSSCPPGQPFGMGAGARPGPASSKCRSEARRERSWFSRPGSSGSSHDCSRWGLGFPAPLTSHHPLLPLCAWCPWVTSVSPCPSVWDQGSSGWRPLAWQLLRGD